ncbi:MAG: hypothetical protein JO022_15515 [Acidobacteriaceae bacterium]|nr:hypothetical protein [Acidobacteriaceae bacterium]
MSSIGSTINSINSSLLSEISSYQSTGSASSTASSAQQADQVDISQVGQLFQDLQQLQSSNPSEFQQVLQDAASKFQTAASQTTDPDQAKVLDSIAARFDQAASTGDLSALQPGGRSGSASGSGSHAAHGHHHHHHAAADTDSENSPATGSTSDLISNLLSGGSTSQSSTEAQSLLASLLTGAPSSS